MEAIYRLAWLKDDSGLVPVNWRDMETEELGSVYESLLELTPHLTDDGRGFAFAEGSEAKGHARKTSGSYYTPDSLVQTLLDSALDPVLNRVEAEADDPAAALLSVTVLDPACGSRPFPARGCQTYRNPARSCTFGRCRQPGRLPHELRYVLDPADVKGPDYQSETFRVLKKKEIARYGDRTARLVLAAYDQLTAKPQAAE
jgi:hypothetical protein